MDINWLSVGAWAVLGFVLADADVSVFDKPWHFFGIMFIVMVIEHAR